MMYVVLLPKYKRYHQWLLRVKLKSKIIIHMRIQIRNTDNYVKEMKSKAVVG